MARLRSTSVLLGVTMLLVSFGCTHCDEGESCTVNETCGSDLCCCLDSSTNPASCKKRTKCNGNCLCHTKASCVGDECCCLVGPIQTFCRKASECTTACSCNEKADCPGEACCCGPVIGFPGTCQKLDSNNNLQECPAVPPSKKC